MVKTFVEGQGSMIDSLEEMIDRQSQEQVSQILLESLWRNPFLCTLYNVPWNTMDVLRTKKIRKSWQ